MQPRFADYKGLIEVALTEDIGRGDITSNATIPEDATATAIMNARHPLVVAGAIVAAQTFDALGMGLDIEQHAEDGTTLQAGDKILSISGNARAILGAERTALNFIQHLSGIATLTRVYVDAVAGTSATILDTRKTLPAYRDLAKHAVRMGGGSNHRFRLDDGVLIKDNHIAIAGGIAEAAANVRNAVPNLIKIEMECDTFSQVQEAAASGAVDIIMLDNMTNEQLTECVSYVRQNAPAIKLEASGNVNLETVRSIAETGIDFISVGRLTHSAPAADIGLDIEVKA